MIAVEICLEQFTDKTFDSFYAIYLEEHGVESPFEPELRERVARHAIDPAHFIVRGIRRKGAGEFLGYCEARNLDDPEWEIGIFLCGQYRSRGVGKKAIPLFLDELAAMGCTNFIARILRSNTASRALFEGLGAVPVQSEGLVEPSLEKTLKEELDKLIVKANDEELAGLQEIQRRLFNPDEEIVVYRISWPIPDKAET